MEPDVALTMVRKLHNDIHNFMEAYIARQISHSFFRAMLNQLNDAIIYDYDYLLPSDREYKELKILLEDAFVLLKERQLTYA